MNVRMRRINRIHFVPTRLGRCVMNAKNEGSNLPEDRLWQPVTANRIHVNISAKSSMGMLSSSSSQSVTNTGLPPWAVLLLVLILILLVIIALLLKR